MITAELLRMVHSDDKAERGAAVEELRGQLPAVRADVLDLMQSGNWRARASAAAVLDHAEQDGDVETALVRATRDEDARVRRSAYHSLSCGHCKPDGCVSPQGVSCLVDGMLNDTSIRVRRNLAGELMWGQHGRDQLVKASFEHLLDSDSDRVLRERAATFLASCDIPRDSMPYREWLPAWRRRISELLAQ